MTSIHPRPRLVYLREDGAGGIELVVKVADDQVVCEPVSPSMAARWLGQLSEHVGGKLKALEGRG